MADPKKLESEDLARLRRDAPDIEKPADFNPRKSGVRKIERPEGEEGVRIVNREAETILVVKEVPGATPGEWDRDVILEIDQDEMAFVKLDGRIVIERK